MGETIHLKLRRTFRIAWWCPHCWQKGELLAARGANPNTIQSAADNRHYFLSWQCENFHVRVEYDSRREIRISEKRLDYEPDFVGEDLCKPR